MGMNKPKSADVGITVRLTTQEAEQIDARRKAAVAGIPGAMLSRAGWLRALVQEHLHQDKADKRARKA